LRRHEHRRGGRAGTLSCAGLADDARSDLDIAADDPTATPAPSRPYRTSVHDRSLAECLRADAVSGLARSTACRARQSDGRWNDSDDQPPRLCPFAIGDETAIATRRCCGGSGLLDGSEYDYFDGAAPSVSRVYRQRPPQSPTIDPEPGAAPG
jgi:hypothetical protein